MANQETERAQTEKPPQELMVQFEGRFFKKNASGIFIPVDKSSQ